MADRDVIAERARAAGLDRAWAEFPDDVAAAVEQASGWAALVAPDDPAAEPWPPMRVGRAR